MPVAICTVCGVKAEGTTVDDYQAAIPGHPFGGRCPARSAKSPFDRLVIGLHQDTYRPESRWSS